MFRYCPSCASQNIRFERNKVFRCPDCGLVYYHNTAAATGCVIAAGDALLFLIRGKEPGRGKLDLPGGFVDPGEGALEGLCRECREEIGWEPEEAAIAFLASFPNTYPYKNIDYTTCDIFFSVSAPGLRAEDLRTDPAEISGVRFIKPAELDFDAIAFDSARRAVRAFLASRRP
jgi:ADP-ribose pyrophosphatase YjhB (NUDIX family)